MISIGNFFFKYRNALFPLFGLSIFIPSPNLFTASVFGEHYYYIPLVAGIAIAFTGQLIRALTIGLRYIQRGGRNKQVYAERLVTEGIFRHCRNPLYVGNILMLLGVGLISNSMVFLLIIVPAFCFIYQCIVLAEENFLRNKFGADYTVYANAVNRWVPNLRGIGTTLNSMQFNWRRYVLNEYNTVYMLLVGTYIVMAVYSPPLATQPTQQRLATSVFVIVVLTIIYLFVRFLKKTKRIDPALAAER